MSVMSLKIPAIRASSVGPGKASLTHLWPGDIETEGPALVRQSHSVLPLSVGDILNY